MGLAAGLLGVGIGGPTVAGLQVILDHELKCLAKSHTVLLGVFPKPARQVAWYCDHLCAGRIRPNGTFWVLAVAGTTERNATGNRVRSAWGKPMNVQVLAVTIKVFGSSHAALDAAVIVPVPNEGLNVAVADSDRRLLDSSLE